MKTNTFSTLTVELGEEEREYDIGGIKYVVTPVYLPSKDNCTFTDRLIKFIGSDFADLTKTESGDIIDSEYVPTAGEEVKCSR